MDAYAKAQMTQTAESLQKLAAIRGLSAVQVTVSDDGRYIANGVDCGPSVHGVYDWLNKQPGVKP